MKVLFTFSGLPHYYNLVLNKLNKINNLDIAVVIPEEGSEGLGKGVHQSEKGIDFTVFKLKTYITYYKKLFYYNFISLLNQYKPDIIVFVWPYNLALLFYPQLLLYIKKNNIKLIYKDIPFLLPKFIDGITGNNLVLLQEDLTPFKLTISKRLYFIAFSVMRFFYYKFFDAHVNYIEDAFEILPTYGISKDKIFITYNSPDTDLLFEAKEKALLHKPILHPSTHRIIHIGRLVKWKKVDFLINSINTLKEKYTDIELIIIGSGPEEQNLKQLANELNLNEYVRFVGAIYDPVILGRYLLDSTIYVIAGMGGLSINEAMTFEKPIICSFCDGTEKKLVRHDFNGKFFANDDNLDLTNKIDELLSDSKNIKNMGENSLSIIKNEVNINVVLIGYINAFNFVTNNKYNLSI